MIDTTPIRVLLVDDHPLVRTGFRDVVAAADGVEVVGECADGAEAVAAARSLRPDVILMDVSMPGLDGIGATEQILAERPDARIVILTAMVGPETTMEALDAGAAGFVAKDADPEAIVAAVRAAAAGESPLDPRAASVLLEARRSDRPALTPREREVLSLVADGLANKQIARRLGIAEKTVKSHLTKVFARIGVSDRTQAALWARERGIRS